MNHLPKVKKNEYINSTLVIILIISLLKGKDKKKGTDSSQNEEEAVLRAKVLELNLKFEVNQFQNFEEFRSSLNTSTTSTKLIKSDE